MTLLITTLAAVVSTVIWYLHATDDKLHVSLLMFMFWGASIMWFVDAIFEFAELKAEYFTPSGADMLNDTFLGLSVVTLALVIWGIYILIKDPYGYIKSKFKKMMK